METRQITKRIRRAIQVRRAHRLFRRYRRRRDLLFAFGHGIKMTLESLGLPFDGDIMLPILQRLEAITESPKNSLVRGGDDIVPD